MDESTRLRARAILAAWLPVLVVAAVVLAGVGGWATYTAHVDPGTTTDQQTTTVWQADSEFDHAATVTRENPVYDVGTVLRDEPAYLQTAAPVLDGTFSVAQDGLTENVSVALEATLVLASADEETTYWTDRRTLNETTVSDADGPVTLAFALNTTRMVERVDEIEASVGTTPGTTNASVVVDASVSGTTADGDHSRLTFSRRVAVATEGDTYAVVPPERSQERVDRTTTVTNDREYGPLYAVGGPLALLVGVAGVGALGIARRDDRIELDETERERLEYLDDRAEFDEWIVSVALPPLAGERRTAAASSLADLVNLAIDEGTAVIEDPDDGQFHVITSEYRYTYGPPSGNDGVRQSVDPAPADDAEPPSGMESSLDEETDGDMQPPDGATPGDESEPGGS